MYPCQSEGITVFKFSLTSHVSQSLTQFQFFWSTHRPYRAWSNELASFLPFELTIWLHGTFFFDAPSGFIIVLHSSFKAA